MSTTKLQESQNQFVFYTLVCSDDNTESTTTASTTVTVSPTTASTGNRQQENNTILIGELSVTDLNITPVAVPLALQITVIVYLITDCCQLHLFFLLIFSCHNWSDNSCWWSADRGSWDHMLHQV